jgi:uncharacterized Zn finger protein
VLFLGVTEMKCDKCHNHVQKILLDKKQKPSLYAYYCSNCGNFWVELGKSKKGS